ncbi:adenylosuccinate lyase [Agrobacterium vitis]|uniref:Adenylosuccinate lyase n=1 Tax=Agrobacterium vitis TaxID=373 RepID=A0ABD6GH14_AGRVI|nr:adenylosuccinate lyase [Agrobacterium vitis]MUO81941.1 adenylosuccinate lyase [Agrobacterium vitis]MUO97046.1 adenylosuccinate lyase [Agrobacterium vitis]MUP08089.1 adenylosuccinate lyase [Agrobacterium vitis]MUZ80627.1 adenylosuccinate lyase [Agrobacterium vitis]MVA09237.1 adenylosuccinate lyase [Agrobacterium vitis]
MITEFCHATAISPIDGRYFQKVGDLSRYFSDFALVKTRLKVEIEYFIRLWHAIGHGEQALSAADTASLRKYHDGFSLEDYEEIQAIERETRHDVKAVEIFLKRRISTLLGSRAAELVHFGLTSQDINDVAIPFLLRLSLADILVPELETLAASIEGLSETLRFVTFIARTHGQPASPSTFGKEFRVFAHRLRGELDVLKAIPHYGKFGGATGNLNAHILVYPDVDWVTFGAEFLHDEFGLVRSALTTQINNHEGLARIFDCLSRIAAILQDLSQDVWLYLSLGLLTLRSEKNEVGSSAMPHKVNPISFENAEGNLQMASAIFSFLSRKLLVSRLQRDLTDYTLKRNIGVPMAHLLLSVKNIGEGLSRSIAHEANIASDLERHFVVVAEGIQTILRSEGIPQSYDLVKNLVRGTSIGRAELVHWIEGLTVSEDIKRKLAELSPETYIGNAKCF